MKNFIGFSMILLCCSYTSNAQKITKGYFPYVLQDSLRWAVYDHFLADTTLNPMVKADSCYSFALHEYELGQFEQARNLCELSIGFASDWPEPHILIGKSYVSGRKLCLNPEPPEKYLKGEALWVAMDEWEKALQIGDKSGMAEKLIEFYAQYLPDEAAFKLCYGEKTLTEKNDFFVNCWIQRHTKVRFRKE